MIQIFKTVWGLMGSIPDIIGIIRWIIKIAQEYEDARQKREFVKEVKEAVRESATSFDNTRLINIFNPTSEPLPRVRIEGDPKV